jgi:hypothetical protein
VRLREYDSAQRNYDSAVTQNFVAADDLIVTLLLPLDVNPVKSGAVDEVDVAGAVKSPGVVVGIADACQ